MANLINEDPYVILRDLLQNNWTSANISGTFDESKRIHTGSYDDNNNYPEVTLTEKDEDHTPDGIDPSGSGLTSWVDGIIQCRVWAPADRDKLGVNPKLMRFELAQEIQDIIYDNQSGTTDSNGNAQLTRIEIGNPFDDVENTDDPVILRSTIPIGYQYHASPS